MHTQAKNKLRKSWCFVIYIPKSDQNIMTLALTNYFKKNIELVLCIHISTWPKAMVVKQYEIGRLAFYYVNLLHNQHISRMVEDNFQHVSWIVRDLNIPFRRDHNLLLDNFFFGIVKPTNFLKTMTII